MSIMSYLPFWRRAVTFNDMSRLFQIGVLLTFAALQACASRPPAVLTPYVNEVQGTRTVNVLSVSTRAPSDKDGYVYSGERSGEPSFAFLEVSIPPNHIRGEIEWPKSDTPDPAEEFAIKAFKFGTEHDIPAWFETQESDGRLFIFVHGYNVRYADAVYRISQISTDLGTGAAPVLFTWPSRGNILSYGYDKSSAMYSRDTLERLLDEATKSEEVKSITILAHSMGGFLTMETLRQSAIRNGRVNRKIADVILASPDIDVDIFETQMRSLGEDRPHFTIVVSNDDRALRLSSLLSGKVPRVGAVNLSDSEIRQFVSGKSNLTLIDLSSVKAGSSLRHSKFANDTETLDVISATMNDAETDSFAQLSETSQAILIELARSVKPD